MPIFKYQLQELALIPLLARSICLNFGFNSVKNYYADNNNNESNKNELIRRCCVIKALMTWHANEFFNVCRERCGGQGYLSANRLGESIEFAHAGMTAEGDNSVLMIKVSKELLGD